MYSFHHIEFIIKEYSNVLPLDIFSFLGSFLEEIIPPIPAALILTTAGVLSLEQGHTWIFLIWLAIAGSLGKTLASWIFYILGDRFEDVVVGKFGKFIGVSHKEVENIGKKFTGGWGDGLGFFAFRCVPIFPSVSVSIVCGIIRMNMKTFLLATFFGSIVKSLLYLYIGFGGVHAIHFFVGRIHQANFWLGLIFLIVSSGLIYWQVTKKKKV